MTSITVFTPTYNRAYILPRCYEGMKNQTDKDFEWLIIDDGSVDETRNLVQGWVEENAVKIRYHYKENGGMHTAHNEAYKIMDTTLCFCCDSDDYLPPSAIADIRKFWDENADEKSAGIAALDAFEDGQLVGKGFPDDLKRAKFRDIYRLYSGDKKYIYKREIFSSYPEYPVFENERFTPLSYKYFLIDDRYDLLTLNKVVCIVEYMQDGSTKNIFRSYKNNPRGFMESRKVNMCCERTFKYRFLNAVQYVMHAVTAGEKRFVKQSPKKFLTLIATPFGLLWFLRIKKSTAGYRKNAAHTQKGHK